MNNYADLVFVFLTFAVLIFVIFIDCFNALYLLLYLLILKGLEFISEKILTTFLIPDNAVVDNELIKTQSGMIIGNHSQIERNLEVGFLMVGESVHVTGRVVSDDDVRIDIWCRFDEDIIGGGDAYIGEYTIVNGKITVEGDLDIGKEVKLNGGFLSKGWVVVRNPLPFMIFIFLYIRELMRLGKTSEEIDKTLEELFEENEEYDLRKLDESSLSDVLNQSGFFVVPLGTKISSESINVPEDAVVGNNCFIDTRFICKKFECGKNLKFRGVLRSKGEVLIDDGSRILGEISTSGKLIIGKNVRIEGSVSARSIIIHDTSFIKGTVSCGNVRFIVGENFDIRDYGNKEKATLLSKSDSFDKMKTNISIKRNVARPSGFDGGAVKMPQNKSIERGTGTSAEAKTAASSKTVAPSKTAVPSKTVASSTAVPSKTVVSSTAVPSKTVVPSKTSFSDFENEIEDMETDMLSDSAPKKRSSRSRQRSAKMARKSQIDNMSIVNVFTGEDVESKLSEKKNNR